MARFSICRIKDEPAIKYHHDLGPFDVYLLDSKDANNSIRFFCPTPITSFLLSSAERRALKSLKNFANSIKYPLGAEFSFKDALHILGRAQGYAGNPLKGTTISSIMH